jgi:hypothetical protein
MLYLLFGVQISRAILGQDQKLRLPKFLEEEEKSPEATKQVRSCNIAYVRDHLGSNDSSCAVQCPVIQAGQSEVAACNGLVFAA